MVTAIEHKKGDYYIITGLLYNSTKRFRSSTTSPMQALCTNLWRGNVWQVRDGRRKLIKRVYN